MLHLLILRYLGSEADAESHVAGHVEYLERHHADGTFLASGQTIPSTEGGAILARGVGRDEARAITEQDPFVRAGVAEYSITTIDVGRAHPALVALLDRTA